MSKLVVSQIEDSGGTSLLRRGNIIINGNFGINQRGVSGTVTLAAGAYGHDRWKAGASGCTYTFATSNNVTTITISAGSLVQVIEGLNVQSGKHVLSWTGTVQMSLNGGTAGASGVTGTLTGGANATVETSGTGTLSLVQLEAGDVATPFEHRSYGQELGLCQRYYYQWIHDRVSVGYPFTLQAYATGAAFGPLVTFPVEMRSTPTVIVSGTFFPFNSTGVEQTAFTNLGNLLPTKQMLTTGGWTGSSGLSAGSAASIGANVGAKINISAEL